MACPYVLAWRGRCGAPVDASGFCSDHAGTKCASCGKQAVAECSHTGQLVCGAPLCDDCESFTDTSKPSGSWGFGNHTHRLRLTCEASPSSNPIPHGKRDGGGL